MLYRSTDRLSRCGAPVKNLAHSASFHSWLNNAPSNVGTKHATEPRFRREAPLGQAHQQLKEELGLDHFECRPWIGLHRHCLMAMIAFAFLQSRRLRATGRKKRVGGPTPQPTMPAIRKAILDLFAPPLPSRCPHCDKHIIKPTSKNLPKKCWESNESVG